MYRLKRQHWCTGVAGSIVEFVKKLDDPEAVTVLGSRGLGAISRSVMDIIGLGSVGEYCVNNLASPVIISKQPPAPADPAVRS